jgi:DNA-binding transcriptional regulator YiaG
VVGGDRAPDDPQAGVRRVTPKQFSKTLTLLGMTQMGFARIIRRNDKTVRDWISGRYPLPTEIAILLNLMLDTKSTQEDLRS